jgi:hypothetical protein
VTSIEVKHDGDGGLQAAGQTTQWEGSNIVCSYWTTICPSYVTPAWLDEAKGQWVCTQPGQYCTVQCVKKEDGTVDARWLASKCSSRERCPPYGLTPVSFFSSQWRAEELQRKEDEKTRNMLTVAQVRFCTVSRSRAWHVYTAIPCHVPSPLLSRVLCSWLQLAGEHSAKLDAQAGNAVAMPQLRDDPAVMALPWNYKGHLLSQLNRPLLNRADERGQPQTVTLVSGLFDLGRGELNTGGFKRPFSEYLERFKNFLRYQLPKVVLIEQRHYEEVCHHARRDVLHLLASSTDI